eukprot:7523485-Pyramimonas_sp.AAC.1
MKMVYVEHPTSGVAPPDSTLTWIHSFLSRRCVVSSSVQFGVHVGAQNHKRHLHGRRQLGRSCNRFWRI